MSRYTLKYERKDDRDSVYRYISAKKVKEKHNGNYVLHSFHNKNKSIVFDIENMAGLIRLTDGQIKEINVIGYQEWCSRTEIKMNVVQEDNTSFLEDNTYNIKFLGCVSFDYNNIDENGFKMNINGETVDFSFNEQNNIRIKSPQNFDVDIRSQTSLQLAGDLVNIAISDPIEEFSIDGRDFNNMIYSRIN